MFKKFLKKSSKFLAVLLTVTLSFTPLSYGETLATSFSNFQTLISDGTAVSDGTITVDSIQAGETEINKDAVLQDYDNLTIKKEGDSNGYINAGGEEYHNAGFEIKEGQTTEINGITFANFYKDKSWELNHKKNPPEWNLVDGGEGAVVFNHSGYLTINDSKFSGNETSAQDEMAFGGAIGHNSSKNGEDVRIGKLTVIGSTFTSNKSMASGAINSTGILEIQNSKFEGNSASMGAGALGMFGHENETSIINNTEFTSNSTNGFGGAIASGGAVDLTITNSQFTGNSANDEGGAITNRPISEEVDYSYAYLTIAGSTFTTNTVAGKGGAIDNYYYQSKNGETVNNYVSVTNTDFIENQAGKGGAIYNHKYYETHEVGEDEYEPNENPTSAKMLIENAKFTGNSATENGGAIYNEGEMTIKESEFSGNTANGTPNDIYNVGTLTILGETSMTGGITASKNTDGEYNAGITTIGDGTIETVLTLGANAVLEQETLNVLANAELSAYIGTITTKEIITNNGLITINGDGSSTLSFQGTGKVKYTGNIEYDDDVEIDSNVEQPEVAIEEGKTVTIGETGTVTTNSISGGTGSEIAIQEGGKLILDLKENGSFGADKLTGNGNFEINASTPTISTVTLNLAGKTIEVSTITATGDKHLVLGGTGESTATINSDVINNMTGHSLELQNTIISGNVYNYPGSPETSGGDGKPVIDISNNVQILGIITNSSGTINIWGNFNIVNVITSTETENIQHNILNIGDTAHYAGVTSTSTIEYQTINVSSGSLALEGLGEINSSKINIAEYGRLTANADNVKSAVTNNGVYDVLGGTISYAITGNGTGSVYMEYNEVKISSSISNSTIHISTSVILDTESYLGDSSSNLILEGDSDINMVNSSTGTVTLNSITVNPDIEWLLLLDVDLATETSDNFYIVDTAGSSIGTISTATVNTINFLSDFTVEQTSATMKISNVNINLQLADPLNILKLYTTDKSYIISTSNDDNGSFLKVLLNGGGSLPQAIHDRAAQYILLEDENVESWIDSDGNDVKADLVIIGNNKSITANAPSLNGLHITDGNTLTINDLAGFRKFGSGNDFTLKTSSNGTLIISTVTFSDNEGEFVIVNGGNTTLSNVTFKDNSAGEDIHNDGSLTINGTGTTSFEKGIYGNDGTTTIDGATVVFGNDAIFEQGSIIIKEDSLVTVNAENITLTASSAIQNAGVLTLFGGEAGEPATYQTNGNEITGLTVGSDIFYGETIFDTDSYITNSANITQSTVTIKGNVINADGTTITATDNNGTDLGKIVIENSGSLTANADDLVANNSIANAGELTFTGGDNNNEITGEGSLNINGTVSNVEGTAITQNAINIASLSSFTANASDIDTSAGTGILNDGDLIFEGSAEMENNNNISGNGDLTINSDLINKEEKEIEQKKVTIGDGSSNNATVTNKGVIRSTDVIINAGSTLVAQGEIDTYGDGEFTDGKITNNGTFIIEGVEDVQNDNTIVGDNGVFKLVGTGFTNREGSITQAEIIIDSNSALTSDLSKLTVVSDIIQNAGILTLSGGEAGDPAIYETNGNEITGLTVGSDIFYGETIFDTGSYIENDADITQSTVTIKGNITNLDGRTITALGKIVIEEGATLTSNAGNLVADNFISNQGDLIFTGGTNTNDINYDGENYYYTGNVIIDGLVTNGSAAMVTASTITVSSGQVLTNSDDSDIRAYYLTGDKIVNNGRLLMELQSADSYLLNELTGTGTFSVFTSDYGDNIDLDISGKTISQGTIYFNGAKSLSLIGGTGLSTTTITATISATNYMTGDSLHLVNTILDTPLYVNTEDSHVVFENGSGVNGVIQNNGGTADILSNSFETKDDITAYSTYQTDITNNILNIGNSENAAVVTSSHTIEYQTITVSSGSLIMQNGTDYGSIKNSSITVSADGLLAVNPENLINIADPITNNGIVKFYGGTDYPGANVNVSTITGSGELQIDGWVSNQEGIVLTQNKITISETSGFEVNANDVDTTAGTGILNDGTIYFVGDNTVNTSTITATDGKGNLYVVANKLENTAQITQDYVDINTGSELENVSEITAYDLAVNGTLTNGTTAQAGTVTVNDCLDNFGTVTNSSGSLNVNHFVNNGGATATNEDGAAIVAQDIINAGTIINKGEATITVADEITNNGVLTTDLANGIQTKVYNEGDGSTTGVYNVNGGTISYNINGKSADKATVNILGDVEIVATAQIAQNTVNLGNGTDEASLRLWDETNLKAAKLAINNNTTLNTMNDLIGGISTDGEIIIADGATWNYAFDISLQDADADILKNVNAGTGSIANINELNILTDSDKAITTHVQISTGVNGNLNVNIASSDTIKLYTTNLKYDVKESTMTNGNSTWLAITADGYGGLPNAVYDGVNLYSVTEAEDYVTKWIEDPIGTPHDTLKADLKINGNDNILLSTNTITGLKTGSYTLAVKDLAEFKGFEDVISVNEQDGILIVNNVLFSENSGSSVISSSGTVKLSSVTFTGNSANIDVDNDGELILTGIASNFEKGIVGGGTTTIKGVAIDMGDAVLAQSRVEISDVADSGLTVKVDNLTYDGKTTDLIMNNSDNLVLIGTTTVGTSSALDTEVKGMGSADLQNNILVNKNIAQTAITLTNADIEVANTGSIFAQSITIDSNSKLATDAEKVNTAANGQITNNGALTFIGGTNNNDIMGTGSLFIEMDKEVVNSTGTQISQKFVEVRENAKFTMNADDVETATTGDIKGIQNNGDLEITGGTNKNIIGRGDGAVPGTGTVIISGNVTNKEETGINQGTITINEGASFKAKADDLATDNGITNAGDLIFIGGTNENIISGDGKVTISSGASVTNNAGITQSGLIIEEYATLSSTASAITANIINNGTLMFNSGLYNDSNANNISGLGMLIVEDTTVNNTAKIMQASMTITGVNAWFTTSADDLNIASPIQNKDGATLEYTGGENNNDIEGDGLLYVIGDVINSTGTKVEQDTIQVDSSGSLIANASDLTANIEMLNNGALEFTGGTISGINVINGDGSLAITGAVINNDKNITQNNIEITADGSFKSNASNLITTAGIENNGALEFTGGTNDNAITGIGNLTIDDTLLNNAAIGQAKVTIENGETTLSDTGSILTSGAGIEIAEGAKLTSTGGEINTWQNGGKVLNNGTVEIDLISANNKNIIDGIGQLVITNGEFNNDYDGTLGRINQSSITVASGAVFTSSASAITTTDGILNEGQVTFYDGINDNEITGSGDLVIDGAVVNSTGTAISQNTITINGDKTFEASANDLTTTNGITNDGELTLTGGTMIETNDITGTGNIIVLDSLINNADIEQTNIDVNGGIFTNVRTSSITADKITMADNTVLITDAGDMDIASGIVLGSESVLNLKDDDEAEISAVISGSGEIIKEGTGVVTLSGTNSYAGDTTISDSGAIRITSASNLNDSTSKVLYMDGGSLIVGENDVTLNEDIMATDHNDVNIEIEDNTTTLNGTIYGNEDLVKTGAGTLDLQMAENKYAGDTRVSSGTLRGTTANINGKLFGTGSSALDTFEFYDDGTDVVLNEVDSTDYLGTFNKTGSSTMTVTKNFHAKDVNITGGVFVINNDTSMGGSGETFTVDGTMLVENALLKGYGDITATGGLIIGTNATFAPGNSTTTYKVTGPMISSATSTYDVEFGQTNPDVAGTYNDKTKVTGAVTIDAGAKLKLNNLEGKYYVHETIDLIDSDTSITNNGYVTTGSTTYTDKGTYKEVVDGTITFLDYDAADLRDGYDTRISTRVYVEDKKLKIDLERKSSEYSTSVEFKRSHNEQEAANSIDTISTGNGGDITSALDTLEKFYYYNSTYDLDALKAALNDVAGVIHANSTNLTFFNAKAEHVYDKINGRTLELYPCTKFHDKIWAEYYYNNYNVDKDDNSPKYESSVNGFLVGFDMLSAKGWTLGIMAGYGTSELKQESDKTTMNDINAGFYGGYEGEKWSFKSMLLGGYEQYDTTRQVAFMERTATSEHNGYSGALDAELGYKISLNKKYSLAKHKMYLRPFIGAMGGYINNEGYKEKGAEDLNLKVEGYDAFSAEARAGVGINGKVKKFGWYAKAGVRQLLTEKYNEIETSLLSFSDETKMKIRSAENSQTTITGGIGADYELSNDWTIFANGLGNFGDKATNYYANVGLTYKFGCINNKLRRDEELEKKVKDLQSEMKNNEEQIKKQLSEAQQREKELQDKIREYEQNEKELKNRIQKYEAKIVSEEEAQKMKSKVIKNVRLEEKPTFVFGTDKLNDKGKESLKQLAKDLEGYPEAAVLVEGHTDNIGSDEINQKLSENRASAIATTLKKDYGVKNDVSVIGKGSKEPIASNDTKEGRAKNRRVEVILTTLDNEQANVEKEDTGNVEQNVVEQTSNIEQDSDEEDDDDEDFEIRRMQLRNEKLMGKDVKNK